ncbi:MAG: DUF4212 domain-containing protein, partial [Hydrogenophaga sp.]|nr:DUF4212 domain-containing protein [Hydrogenophaga sp.]
MAGPFPPDLHDQRHLWLKAGLLLVGASVLGQVVLVGG